MDPLRELMRESAKQSRHQATARRLQKEAADRPESTLVTTPYGQVWMSPIETKLYDAMSEEGLAPQPQYCVEGYFVDFAFPDVRLAVEADGAEFHSGDRHKADKKRDWILRNAGWTVKRFHGTTIYNKAGNCAFVIKREVEVARTAMWRRAEEEERARQARRDAWLRPLRWLFGLFGRKRGAEVGATSQQGTPREGPPLDPAHVGAKCGKCGSPQTPGATFCSRCGTKL